MNDRALGHSALSPRYWCRKNEDVVESMPLEECWWPRDPEELHSHVHNHSTLSEIASPAFPKDGKPSFKLPLGLTSEMQLDRAVYVGLTALAITAMQSQQHWAVRVQICKCPRKVTANPSCLRNIDKD